MSLPQIPALPPAPQRADHHIIEAQRVHDAEPTIECSVQALEPNQLADHCIIHVSGLERQGNALVGAGWYGREAGLAILVLGCGRPVELRVSGLVYRGRLHTKDEMASLGRGYYSEASGKTRCSLRLMPLAVGGAR